MSTVEHLIDVISNNKKYSDNVRYLINTEASNDEWEDLLIGISNNENLRYDLNLDILNYVIGKLYSNDIERKLQEQTTVHEYTKRDIEVTCDNGEVVTTSMVATTTDDDILTYFSVGNEFNLENIMGDNMAKVKKVKILEGKGDKVNTQPKYQNVSRLDAMRSVVDSIRTKDYVAATASFNDFTTTVTSKIVSEDYGDNETKLYDMIIKIPKYKNEVEDMKYNGADGEEFRRFVADISRSTGLKLSGEETLSLAQTLMRTKQ